MFQTSDHSRDFPHAILHVDGDSFFVSCELARRPGLWGKPVVTGLERGIASAMSPEAKARGISRGMRIGDMRRVCPEVVILPDDYDMYAIYARRMYSIVRRYTPDVEEYSIDECFADLTGCDEAHKMSYEQLVRTIQKHLFESLGMTFSVGLSVNKVMAKIASKWNKPNGLTIISALDIPKYLAELSVGKVWGIGRSSTVLLRKLSVTTTLEFARKDRRWLEEHCNKPLREIYEELNGAYVMPVASLRADDQKSIQKTGTFRPPSRDKAFLFSQLSHNIENACIKLRSYKMLTTHVSFFIKTQEFNYIGTDVHLPEAVATPQEIILAIKPQFDRLFRGDLMYRATGVTLSGLVQNDLRNETLFGPAPGVEKSRVVYQAVDRLANKYGRQSIFLGSSLTAIKADEKEELQSEARAKKRGQESYMRHVSRHIRYKKFALPFLGEVR